MIIDDRLEFCDAVSLNTGGANSYLLGDQVDLGATVRNVGVGEELYLVLQVDTSAGSGGSATGQFHLVSDAQAAIATDGSATYHFSTGAIPFATLVAGYVIAIVALPQGGPAYERYLGILQTTGTAAFNAGRINAFLTKDPSNWRAYDAPAQA
jgi:hypothetical protein